ncbi:MAG: hypothetical protein V1872_01120 [bacterium]
MKIFKCCVKGNNDREQIRFVPATEYNLWNYLMKNKHKIEVMKKEPMLWVNESEFKQKENIYSCMNHEKVIKITIYLFSMDEEITIPAIRFFADDDYLQLKPIVMSHFQEKEIEDIVEEKGYCVDANSKLIKAARQAVLNR